jgi:hypothetical protein
VSAAPDHESGWGLEFCRPFRVETQYSDSTRLCHKGRQSGWWRRVCTHVEVTLSAVSMTEGVEPASLAPMAQVTGSVSS